METIPTRRLTDNETELEARLLKAALDILPFLPKGSMEIETVNAIYIPPAQALRNAADRIERQDAAISRFRAAVDAYRVKTYGKAV